MSSLHLGVAYDQFTVEQSGGARQSLLTILRWLNDVEDISVTVYQPNVETKPDVGFEYEVNTCRLYQAPKIGITKQPFARWQWKRFLRKELSADIDLLLTQTKLGPASVEVAHEKGIPSAFFIRSLGLMGCNELSSSKTHLQNFLQARLGYKPQYPLLYLNYIQYAKAIEKANLVLANSNYTRGEIRDEFGQNTEVIYPPIDEDTFQILDDVTGEYITMANPRRTYKGPDIFLKIAGKLTDKKFRMVGRINNNNLKDKVQEQDNIEWIPWSDNIERLYNESSCVLVPSRYEEPFGRVAAEALMCGTRVIVSDKGGLPEIVGDDRNIVTNVESVNEWIQKIQSQPMRSPQQRRDAALEYSKSNQVEKFHSLLSCSELI